MLIVIPVNDRSKFEGLSGDCVNHAIWIHDRIVNNNTPIDIAFIGSSHTMYAINDDLITNKLGQKITNLGYCRFGRNLTYLLTKKLTEHKTVKHIVFEVREKEDLTSHPMFPYLATTKETLLPHILFNQKYFSDIWNHFAYKIELTQDFLFKNNSSPISKELYGVRDIDIIADTTILNDFKRRRQQPEKEVLNIEREFHNQFPLTYLEEALQLCKSNNIKTSFIYIPSYGTKHLVPTELETYSKWGNVLIPPKQTLESPTNWCDENHLNSRGGLEISEWLINELNN